MKKTRMPKRNLAFAKFILVVTFSKLNCYSTFYEYNPSNPPSLLTLRTATSATEHNATTTLMNATLRLSPNIMAIKNPLSHVKTPKNFCLVYSDSSCVG